MIVAEQYNKENMKCIMTPDDWDIYFVIEERSRRRKIRQEKPIYKINFNAGDMLPDDDKWINTIKMMRKIGTPAVKMT